MIKREEIYKTLEMIAAQGIKRILYQFLKSYEKLVFNQILGTFLILGKNCCENDEKILTVNMGILGVKVQKI